MGSPYYKFLYKRENAKPFSVKCHHHKVISLLLQGREKQKFDENFGR
jgi:hypothetical protein